MRLFFLFGRGSEELLSPGATTGESVIISTIAPSGSEGCPSSPALTAPKTMVKNRRY